MDFAKTKLLDEQKHRQIEFLEYFINLAANRNLPLVFHIRDALDEFVETWNRVIKELNNKNLKTPKAEIHCYNGVSWKKTQELISMRNSYFRIGGKIKKTLENIDKELEKLICYTLDKTEISAADVEAICTGQTENKIFEMIDAISAKNKKKALDLYYDLLALKEAPMRILFLIARQFQNLLLIKSMSAKGYPAVSIAKTAGMPSFAVQKNLRQAGAFKINQLKEAIEDCGQAEEDVKTGSLDEQLAVELLIVKYSA